MLGVGVLELLLLLPLLLLSQGSTSRLFFLLFVYAFVFFSTFFLNISSFTIGPECSLVFRTWGARKDCGKSRDTIVIYLSGSHFYILYRLWLWTTPFCVWELALFRILVVGVCWHESECTEGMRMIYEI
jgi:hypothetical protein